MQRCIVIIFSILSLLRVSIASEVEVNKKYNYPVERVALNQYPTFDDDLSFENMDLAIKRQLKRFKKRNLNHSIKMGTQTYTLKDFRDTLLLFQQVMKETKLCFKNKSEKRSECLKKLNKNIKSKFYVYKPKLNKSDTGFGEKDYARFTGYATPTLNGSFKKSKKYNWGIYSKPKEEALRTLTRVEIDFDNKLVGSGYDTFYIDDLFESYLLHVEGGGKVVVNEGGEKKFYYISYDGTNSQKWNFIARYMMEKGYIDNYSIAAQRKFLLEHPELQNEIYAYCPSFVYFKISDTPPLGSDLVPLSDNRSIATDYRIYSQKGLLSFIKTQRLKDEESSTEYRDFSRFMIDQDTGGAIKGKARVDIYFGENKYATRAAELQHHMGQIYFLMKK